MRDVAPVVDGRPPFDEQQAARIAAVRYGIVAQVSELPSDRDRNFHLRSDRGEFVLKFANLRDDHRWLEVQMRAMTAVGPLAPQPVPAIDGAHRIEVVDRAGVPCSARLVRWLPGRALADVRPIRAGLLRELGGVLARVARELAGLGPLPGRDDFAWHPARAVEVIATQGADVEPVDRRAMLATALPRVRAATAALGSLASQPIHNDANDHNILVARDGLAWRICGLLDFGDMVEAPAVCDLAVAAAYAALDAVDPLAVVLAVTEGYDAERALVDAEFEVLFEAVIARLAVSVCMSARQRRQEPDNEYLSVSEAPAWRTLARLLAVRPAEAVAVLRRGCGRPALAASATLAGWLAARRGTFAPVLGRPLASDRVELLDLSVASPDLPPERDPGDVAALHTDLARWTGSDGSIAIGRYGEARLLYTAEQFAGDGGERRTVHLGVDLFAAAGVAVHAPLDGVVHAVADNAAALDYGPTVILRHTPDDGPEFHTLYGHLARTSVADLVRGDRVAAGTPFAALGAPHENGGWPPHLHLQLIAAGLGEHDSDFPGVAAPSREAGWRDLSPDPSDLVGLPVAAPAVPELGARRATVLGRNLSVSYRQPLHIVRGRGAHLFDVRGRRYLDLVNNVCHVGHCHPHVVAAARRQLGVLNTNTRYLHEQVVDYAERLLATLPAPLAVVFFVNSGSEANDLALRLACTHTRRRGVVVLDGAYHGHTAALIDASPYKHSGPGGLGPPAHVRVAPMPDPFRGPFRGAACGPAYAAEVAAAAATLGEHGVAAFLTESLLGCGGQIEPPPGYLSAAFAAIRAHGGVCIADEVQVGFGRVGDAYWGFELQGVVPDIVTLGKPIGDGHPLAAVVTTAEIAASFANGMEYFNTFGGNPVSCAIGAAVLDVIERERLRERAARLGQRFVTGLRALADRQPLIGDVRGRGLFLGIELIRDRTDLEPAAAEATYVVERAKELGILLSTDGPLHNVLKIKPPLVLDEMDVDSALAVLAEVFSDPLLSR